MIKKVKREKGAGGLFIAAGLFLGLGIGFFIDQVKVGLFVGLGAGFLAAAIYQVFTKNKK